LWNIVKTVVVDVVCISSAGLQDSDDEDLEHDIDQQIENMLAPKRIVKEIKAPIGMNPGAPGTFVNDDTGLPKAE
jgi:ATP-dependent RNA helicase DDX46/PRP5